MIGERLGVGGIAEPEIEQVVDGFGARGGNAPDVGGRRPHQARFVQADLPDEEAAEGLADRWIGRRGRRYRCPDDLIRAAAQAQPIADVDAEGAREAGLDHHASGPHPGALEKLAPVNR